MTTKNARADKPKDNPPTGLEYAQWDTFLIRQGYTPEQRHEAIGTGVAGRSRQEIADQLRAWLFSQTLGE